MALVIVEVAKVLLAIRPVEVSLPMHLVVDPCAHVLFAISPGVRTRADHLIHLELALVNGRVSESKSAVAVPLSFGILSIVDGTIRLGLKALSFLLIIFPFTNIFNSIIGVGVGAMPVSLIIDPLSFINITRGVVELTHSIRFSLSPLPLVAAFIGPSLLAISITFFVKPLTFIDCPILHCNVALFDSAILIRISLNIVVEFWLERPKIHFGHLALALRVVNARGCVFSEFLIAGIGITVLCVANRFAEEAERSF